MYAFGETHLHALMLWGNYKIANRYLSVIELLTLVSLSHVGYEMHVGNSWQVLTYLCQSIYVY